MSNHQMDISFTWKLEAMAYALRISVGSRYSGILVVGFKPPSWWQLFRRWNARQYRRRIARMMSHTLGETFDRVDRAIPVVMRESGDEGVSLS